MTNDSMKAALLSLPGVTRVQIFEYPEAHTIEIVVVGGQEHDIGKIIYDMLPAGISTIGTETVVICDTKYASLRHYKYKFTRGLPVTECECCYCRSQRLTAYGQKPAKQAAAYYVDHEKCDCEACMRGISVHIDHYTKLPCECRTCQIYRLQRELKVAIDERNAAASQRKAFEDMHISARDRHSAERLEWERTRAHDQKTHEGQLKHFAKQRDDYKAELESALTERDDARIVCETARNRGWEEGRKYEQERADELQAELSRVAELRDSYRADRDRLLKKLTDINSFVNNSLILVE